MFIDVNLFSLGPDEMEILLQFMYGAVMDLPSGANARYHVSEYGVQKSLHTMRKQANLNAISLPHSQVTIAADMLGLEGLKDLVEMIFTRDYCRFFPKVREASVLLKAVC